MNRLFPILFCTLFTGSILSAQDYYYGPKVGFNVSHIFFSGDDTETLQEMSGMKISTHIGGFVEIVFNEYFSVQPELLYTVKGARFRDGADEEYKSAFVYKYITLPVIAKYYIKERISIEGGPYVSYLLSAKNVEINGLFSSNLGSEAAAIDLKGDMNTIDAGIALGVGYMTKSGFYFSTRYEFGLLNTAKKQDEISAKMSNGNIMLTAGFGLNY
jgi:hypothetical protein